MDKIFVKISNYNYNYQIKTNCKNIYCKIIENFAIVEIKFDDQINSHDINSLEIQIELNYNLNNYVNSEIEYIKYLNKLNELTEFNIMYNDFLIYTQGCGLSLIRHRSYIELIGGLMIFKESFGCGTFLENCDKLFDNKEKEVKKIIIDKSTEIIIEKIKETTNERLKKIFEQKIINNEEIQKYFDFFDCFE
jgi:hypothetical protein